jgi:hypothetical protein
VENNKFLAKINEFNPSDYFRAGIVPLYYDSESGLFEISKTPDDGDIFLVYLVKKHDEGVECVDTVKTYKEAKQLFDNLRDWLIENEFEILIDDDEWR